MDLLRSRLALLLMVAFSNNLGESPTLAQSGAVPSATSAKQTSATTIAGRFPAPKGCSRVELSSQSYGYYLRHFPLKAAGSQVYDHSGAVVHWGQNLGAVLDIDLLKTKRYSDLQQCADLAMRLWAEYLWRQKGATSLSFQLQNGQKLSWQEWRKGVRGAVVGNRHRFVKTAGADQSYKNFRAYLGYVMTWLGSAGVKAYAQPVAKSDVTVGDLFVQNNSGGIGHVSIVVDKCLSDAGPLYLIAQSYMPAQDGHIVLPAAGQGVASWFTLEGLAQHQSLFGKGVFRRF